jgi:hypothetical protein
MEEGNRNNILIRYAMMLKDSGMKYKEVASKITELNNKATHPLKTEEVTSTVLKSIGQKYAE